MKFIKHLLIAAIIMPMFSHAQDIIVMRDGSIVQSKVTEITSSEVKYKKYSNLDGPLYTIDKSTILAINYENGEKETFSAEEQQPTTPSPTPEPMTDEVSEEAKQRNREAIQRINSIIPEATKYAGKKVTKLYCALGVSEDSYILNDDLELLISTTTNPNYGHNGYGFNWIYVTIKNNTKKMLYIDLGNTFFISGGATTVYYVPTTTSVGKTTSTGVGVNAGAVTNALGVGGSLGKLASGVTVGGGGSSSTVSVTYSQRVIAIPPMSTTKLEEQGLFNEEGIYGNGIYLGKYGPCFSLGKREYVAGEAHSYTKDNSPIKFNFYITYSFTEDCSVTKVMNTELYGRYILGYRSGDVKTFIDPKGDIGFYGRIDDETTSDIMNLP